MKNWTILVAHWTTLPQTVYKWWSWPYKPVISNPNMACLAISSAPLLTIKPVLIIEGGGAEHVLKIGGMIKTNRLYQPKDLNEVEEKKEKGKRPWLKSHRERKGLKRMTWRVYQNPWKEWVFSCRKSKETTWVDIHIVSFVIVGDTSRCTAKTLE